LQEIFQSLSKKIKIEAKSDQEKLRKRLRKAVMKE
jgi:hypothetical protein